MILSSILNPWFVTDWIFIELDCPITSKDDKDGSIDKNAEDENCLLIDFIIDLMVIFWVTFDKKFERNSILLQWIFY